MCLFVSKNISSQNTSPPGISQFSKPLMIMQTSWEMSHLHILPCDLFISHTTTHYLLLQRHPVLLLKAFALADQVALLGEDGGGGGRFVGGAALAAAAAQSPHLLLVAADAVCTAQGASVSLRLAHIQYSSGMQTATLGPNLTLGQKYFC